MGFNFLLLGVIILANPFHAATDLIAAVIIAAATARAENMLRDFNRARVFSYGLMGVSIALLLCSYVIPSELGAGIAEIWRYGLIIPIQIYLLSGISDFAMINENAELYDRAKRLHKPVYIFCILAAISEAVAIVWPTMRGIVIIARSAASVVTAVLGAIIHDCNKAVTNTAPPEKTTDEESPD